MAGPGHWNDPDMLQVGNNILSLTEEQTHFSLWAFAKAPLLIGTDLTKINNDSLAILTNDWIIGVNQDLLGQQATQVTKLTLPTDVAAYASRVSDGEEAWIAVLIVNWGSKLSDVVELDLIEAGIAEHTYDNCRI